ncbi:HAD family hydrolase [uncultured Cocleimonas sp.]|uniref:HAD family hydrolase n=1 Tax=uncultured Cocleimonas sp. TaxID=1051587 RepID=UPI00262D37C4|nr:HAD family hydrolase [uncultured Cocleimonas sp.]
MNYKTLYALDFDGVICNSAIETARTSWKAAQTLWPDMQYEEITESRIQAFVNMRPCLEVGYEALLIMRLLQQQTDLATDCSNYHEQIQSLISDNDFNVDALQMLFGRTRDETIQKDEAAWLSNNPLFDGVSDKLKQLNPEDWLIITTKQERFVKKTLQGNDIELADDRLFGLDKKLSKQAVLENLVEKNPDRPITFIEDRLPTLLGVQQNPALTSVKLQLVDWGYNTLRDQQIAREKGIEVIGLESFLISF